MGKFQFPENQPAREPIVDEHMYNATGSLSASGLSYDFSEDETKIIPLSGILIDANDDLDDFKLFPFQRDILDILDVL